VRRTPLRRTAELPRTGRLRRRRLHADPVWCSVRVGVFSRSGGRCERCGGWLTVLWQAHHRKLRSAGGQASACNAVALCRRCHRTVHSQPATSTAAGWIVPASGDPARVPVWLHDGRVVLLAADGTYTDAPREQATA
jgi:5-methylcytosine-specific restriction endonuclease McrA